MSKRTYEEYISNECHPVGYNEACGSYYFAQSSVDILLDRIHSLEEQLKNAIVPKFKIGQEVWAIRDNELYKAKVKRYEYDVKIYKLDTNEKVYSLAYGFEIEEFGYNFNIWEEDVFATREEALKRLAELKGE